MVRMFDCVFVCLLRWLVCDGAVIVVNKSCQTNKNTVQHGMTGHLKITQT
jgi:hypothetical protein